MEKRQNTSAARKWLFPIIFFRSIVGGLFGSLTHVMILSIAESFGLSTGELGGLLSANYVASIVMPFVAGRLGDLFGKKRVLVASIFVNLIGSAIIITAPTVEMYVLGTIIGGFGGNAENSILTPALADTYPDRATRYISWMQVFGSVSGIVSPLIISALNVRLNLDWRAIKLISVLVMLIPYISTLFIKLGSREEGKTARSFKEVMHLLSDPTLLIGALLMIVYCATDNTYANFVSIFYTENFGAVEAGALALTLNSAMYALARFLIGFMKKGHKTLGIISLAAAAVFLVLAATAPNPTMALIFCTLYSLSFAPVYPLVVSNAAVSYPGNSATATSLMFVGGGIGCFLITTPASKVVGNYGADTLFIVLAVTSVISMVLYWAYCNALKKKQLKEEIHE